MGAAFALSGRHAEALPLLRQAIAQTPTGRHGIFLPRWAIRLGEGYLLSGRIEEAMIEAQRALTLARDSKQRGQEAWALRLFGTIAAQQKPPAIEPAEAHYRQASAIADELKMRPLLAHCHLERGTFYRRLGRRDAARTELSTTIDLYRAMEMVFWLSRAEAELTQVV